MDKKLSNAYLRIGRTIDMESFLGELDSLYLADLNGTIESYDTYEEVANETLNDLVVTSARLSLLHRLGYLDEEERREMEKTAQEMRLKKLEALEDGSKLQNNS